MHVKARQEHPPNQEYYGKDEQQAAKKEHDWSAPFTATQLRQSYTHTHNPITDVQGLVNAGTPDEAWMLVAEIPAKQSPNHYALMVKVALMCYSHDSPQFIFLVL